MTNTQAPPLDPQTIYKNARSAEIRNIQAARRAVDKHKEAMQEASAAFAKVIGQAHVNQILTPQEVEQAGHISPTYRRRLESVSGYRTPTTSAPTSTAEYKRAERQRNRARQQEQEQTDARVQEQARARLNNQNQTPEETQTSHADL